MHYQNDLSLTEIGEELSISRQAVCDQLKRTEKILQDYEEKLQLVSRFQAQKKAVQEMKHIMEGMEKKNPDAAMVKALSKMKKIAEGILS